MARRWLERRGFEVFKGFTVRGREHSLAYHTYPNVKRKYNRLERILRAKLGRRLKEFRLSLESGLPDYFAWHRRLRRCIFVEVKLEHEQLKDHQLECMRLLEGFGFDVMVIRVKSRIYREVSEIDTSIDDAKSISNRKVLVRQEKIRVRY